MEEVEHLPSQKKDRDQNHQHSHHFAEAKTTPAGLEAARSQAKNVQRSEAEHDRPQDVIDVISRSTIKEAGHNAENYDPCLGTRRRVDRERGVRAASNLGDQKRGYWHRSKPYSCGNRPQAKR
jgi:hypothetical protein